MSEAEKVAVEAVEAWICKLPSVLRCRVVTNDWGGIEEIHVLASTGRSPKQVVRDVETTLLANWNLRVDHKRISVAQIPSQGPSGRAARLVIREYRLEYDTLKGEGLAEVTLGKSGDDTTEYRGSWRGRSVAGQSAQLMAQAAVDALSRVPEIPEALALIDLASVAVAGRQVMVAALSHLTARRREELLVGAAVDRGDSQGTAVRAVLAAVNRRLGIWARSRAGAASPPAMVAETAEAMALGNGTGGSAGD